MPKVLKPYTIIPSNLYVHRDADRQVKNIIKDMGRPGYVLVSRQMGKTNLLLNAKRELETADDVFVYIDLSNPFPNSKECFENIIDTAIETNLSRFEKAKNIISDRREGLKDTPSHKQHTNELRILLNSIPGKLVIILDEIDALTKTTYSDQIFSQIRSVYFSRVNFEELNRLTYLLSGVIEPTDIIKDPKISPFNIGQKIFLNDFSRAEFHSFLEKAGLTIDESSAERIFYWTNGNPRMTWDLCSEIENASREQSTGQMQIDKIVEELYLTKYDKPPIDNIRELVIKDREIRNAVIGIEQNSTNRVTDRLKSKLYLAGIINYEETQIQIKNNIISNCLNTSWLKSLELEEKGLFENALTLIDKGKYREAIEAFEKFLEGTDFEENQRSLSYFNMSYASIQLSEFDMALKYSDLVDFDKQEEPKWFFRHKLQRGLIHYYRNEVEESLAYFKDVIDSSRKDENYLRAILNYGSISFSSDLEQHKEVASNIFNDIINEVGFDRKKLKQSFVEYLKTVAYFNLSQLNRHNQELDQAKQNLLFALEFSKENTRPVIILSLLSLVDDPVKKVEYLSEIVNLILTDKIKPIEIDFEKPLDFTFKQFREVLLAAYSIDKNGAFSNLRSKLNVLGSKSYANHLYDLAVYGINNKEYEIGRSLLEEVLSSKNEELDKKTAYNSIKMLAYLDDNKKSLLKQIEYLDLFKQERTESIDYLDFEIFANIIFQLTNRQNFKDALKYVSLINSLFSEVDKSILINYLVIYHLELNIYLYTKDPKAINKAKEIVAFASRDEFKQQSSNLLGDTGLEIIRQNAESILKPKSRQITPVKVGRVYGRNEIVKVRYKDGTILETKFKKIEGDVKNGECFILVS